MPVVSSKKYPYACFKAQIVALTRRVICAYFQGLFAKTEDFIAQNLTIVVFLEA
jgi:hypothetical protein